MIKWPREKSEEEDEKEWEKGKGGSDAMGKQREGDERKKGKGREGGNLGLQGSIREITGHSANVYRILF